jgi:hypothetical protein
MKLSSSDRKALVNLAGSLPKGSAERRAILAGLKKTAAIKVKKVTDKAEQKRIGKEGVQVAAKSLGPQSQMIWLFDSKTKAVYESGSGGFMTKLEGTYDSKASAKEIAQKRKAEQY